MPQIRCPNCGLTINLENRKELDIGLITNAIKRGAKTFTELLNITKLPRKTLYLRLQEMSRNGVLTNKEGIYRLNGYSGHQESLSNSFSRFSSVVHDKRMKGLVVLALLVISLPSASYVMAMFFPSPAQRVDVEPQALGTSTAVLEVCNVNDLYAWQIVVSFDPDELKVLDIKSGEFLKAGYPFLPVASDLGGGLLLMGNTLMGDMPGVDGSGALAIIEFAYFVENYKDPQIVQAAGSFETRLFNSRICDIPISELTLKLTFVGND